MDRQTTRIYEPSPLEGYFSGQVQTMAWETDTNPFIPEEWLGMSFCSYFGFNIYLHFDKFPAKRVVQLQEEMDENRFKYLINGCALRVEIWLLHKWHYKLTIIYRFYLPPFAH